jgi:predicted DNA-binding protein (MmcQ/YjbR family)
MEQEIFKKSIILKDKLLEYGFIKEKDTYLYKKSILNNNFEIIISIRNNKVKAKIIDKELDEEYLNYRIENQIGEFVSTIRNELRKTLEDIKEKCTLQNIFIYKQSNRISNWIKEKYNVEPEFIWDDDKNAVFRNNDNKKWFGIIMYVNKNKLAKEDKMVEVMNVKLPPETIDTLVTKQGYYRAYHMNKKYWMSIILNNTKDDKEIMDLINTSYKYTE